MAQLVDSNQKKLSMQEIIDIAAENTKTEYSKEQVLGALYKELTMPGSLILQIGNTIFMVHRVPEDPTTAMMRALNADTAQNYLDNAEEFAGTVYKKYKIQTIVSDFTDPSLANIFAYVGRNQPANMGYKLQQSRDGKTYRAIAKLGPDFEDQ